MSELAGRDAGFHTYNALSERDDDPIRRKTLRHMAEAEAHHASLWAKRIRELGAELPDMTVSRPAMPTRWRTGWAARRQRCGGWRSTRAATLPVTGNS